MTPSPPLALLLDFDGTLVPTASTPDGVTVSSELHVLLGEALARLEGRLAIVSGRSLEQLDALWGRTLWPVTVAASHGLELRHDGHRRAPPSAAIFARLSRLAEKRFGARNGVVSELKSFGLGIHYRLAPRMGEAVRRFAEVCAAENDLVIQEGDMVWELRLPGADKGDAVRAIMKLPAFAGSLPVYIGDDFTDIAAIDAVRDLGGRGIAVGDRIAAAADAVLASPADVHHRIRALIEGQPEPFMT